MSLLPSLSQFALEVIHGTEYRRGTTSPIDQILAPLRAAAQGSSSLVVSQHSMEMSGEPFEISKFLLLGERGGGHPICVGLFAGFETGSLETVRALAQLLLQLKSSRNVTRDYAFFGYPVVNVRSFTMEPPLATTLSGDSADVHYFESELEKWRFDGLFSFRVDAATRGFYATVSSKLIATEVVEPALAAASRALPLAAQAVKVRTSNHRSRTKDSANGRLTSSADIRPSPFEIDLHFPHDPLSKQHVDGLFVALKEILRLYRAFIAHGKDL